MERTALTRDNVKHTDAIRFWSSGKMAESAYDRMTVLKKKRRDADALVILEEWIIEND